MMKNRRILFSCAALLVVLCLCLALIGIAGAGFSGYQNLSLGATATHSPAIQVELNTPTFTPIQPGATPTPPDTHQAEATPTPLLTATPEGTPAPTLAGLPVSPAVVNQMKTIEVQVEQIRQVTAKTEVDRILMSRDQLQTYVESEFFKDSTPQEYQDQSQLFILLGLYPAGFDLQSFYSKLLGEQVAGFYDTTTKEMVVVQGENFSGLERLTYAHEFTHALQDQNFNLEGATLSTDNKVCLADSERCAAISALVEGDATLSEEDWLTQFATAQDQADLRLFYTNTQFPVLNSAPDALNADFTFPYSQGLEFVQSLFDQGGWQAVDKAFLNPPVSTEQILHPERYPDDKPIPVSLPDLLPTLGSGWHTADHGTVGEWYLYLILAKGTDKSTRLPDQTARAAAKGWGGDAYAFYSGPTGNAFVTVARWDTPKDAGEFSQAFNRYGSARWGKSSSSIQGTTTWNKAESFVQFTLQGNTITWIMAPDQATAQSIFNLVNGKQ
jgi:hypothetical protein